MKYILKIVTLVGGVSLGVVTAGILAVFCFSTPSAYADTQDWFAEGATAELIEDSLRSTPRMLNHSRQCKTQEITIVIDNMPGNINSCIYQAKSFRFGWVPRHIDGQDRSSLAISLGTDSKFYMINNLKPQWWNDSYWHASTESDDIVFSDGKVVMIFKDVPTLLDRDFDFEGVSYRIRYPEGKFMFGNQGRFVSVAISANGEWLSGFMEDYGMFRMRLSDGSVRLVARMNTSRGYHFDISNDGVSIVDGGGISYADTDTTTHAKIFSINADCGKEAVTFWTKPSQLGTFTDCPSKSLNDILEVSGRSQHGGDRMITGVQYPRFNDDGNTIELLQFRAYWPGDWVRLYKPGYMKPPGLEYLAMGDSYSSGEGDVGRKPDGSSYYLPGTDQNLQCHLSSRSYPFLLRDYYSISNEKMKSVACSGAQVVSDYLPQMKNYIGQHEELMFENENDREQMRQGALINFIPGIVPQIEFVKRYKPKTVTLTGGGNDVGFANILVYCATPHWEDFVVPSSVSDCGYAQSGSYLEELLIDAIDTQYAYNRRLIGKIKELSPNTKIVIVGYPSFISSNSQSCSLTFNSGTLSQAERAVINAALSRMNNMLKKVAHDMAVSYVDIEDALNDGRMCEGSEYITGVTAAGYGNVILGGNAQETFHPNALGHERIADTIKLAGLFSLNTIPGDTDYLPSEDKVTTLPMTLVENARVALGSSTKLLVKPLAFRPDSLARLIGFSDKVELGSYRTDYEGKISEVIDVSKLPVGKHMLILEGVTFSGETVRYYQFLDVFNPRKEDISTNEPVGRSEEKNLGSNAATHYSTQSVLGLKDTYPLGSQNSTSVNTQENPGVGGNESTHSSKEVSGVSVDLSWKTSFFFSSSVLLVGGVLYAFKRQRKQN